MYFNKDFSLPTGYRFLLKDVIRFLSMVSNKLPKHAKLIDIGCGTKPYASIFSNVSYIGIDNGCETNAIPDIDGSILSIPLNNESVDAALTVFVLDDVFELTKGLREISRVLKKGGCYYAIECQSTHIHNPPHDYFRFAPSALKSLCEREGLMLQNYYSFAGDVGNIGFSIITFFRVFFGSLKIDKIMRPIYCLLINILFRPLDVFLRKPFFKDKFKINSIGYCYTFVKC